MQSLSRRRMWSLYCCYEVFVAIYTLATVVFLSIANGRLSLSNAVVLFVAWLLAYLMLILTTVEIPILYGGANNANRNTANERPFHSAVASGAIGATVVPVVGILSLLFTSLIKSYYYLVLLASVVILTHAGAFFLTVFIDNVRNRDGSRSE